LKAHFISSQNNTNKKIMIENPPPLITNDAVVLGILMTILGLIFITSSSEKPFKKFWNSPIRFIMLFYSGTFQHPSYLRVFQSIHHCVSLLITCEFSTTYLEYQFCCIKKTRKHYVFSWNFGNNRGPFALYIVGSFYPEVALSNGEVCERVINNCEVDWLWCKSNLMLEVFGKQKHVAQMIAGTSCQFMDGVLLYGQKSDKIDKWLKADISRIRKNSKKNKQKEKKPLII
jgi:hypothetical protein